MSLLQEREDRIRAAVALEPVDKVPLVSGAAACVAPATGTSVSAMLKDLELNCTIGIEYTDMMGDVDGVQATLACPEGLPGLWLSNIEVPGEDIEDNQLWQVIEAELVTDEDYDKILEGGYAAWYADFCKNKLRDCGTRIQPLLSYIPTANKRFNDAGYVVFKDAYLESPFEMLCGGRSLMEMMMDVVEDPDKIEAVFEKVHEFNVAGYEAQFSGPGKPMGAWVGGWRGTPGMLAPEQFERFSWKYMKELVQLCLDYDVIPILHLDSDWTRGLHYFRELPAKKCVMALDGMTDIFKANEVVGDMMCIMGDVDATRLAFGTQQDVYDYTMKLLREIGPVGYIACSGCDIPFNAKIENVQMMSKAIEDFTKERNAR